MNLWPRRAKYLIPVALLVLALLLFAVVRAVQGNQDRSAIDARLKQTAERILPTLRQPDSKYGNEGTFLRSFQRYVGDTRIALGKSGPRYSGRGQFEQVQLVDTRSMPPQSLMLNLGHRALLYPEAQLVTSVMEQQKPAYTAVHAKGRTYRVYIVPLRPPAIFSGQGVSGVLEVFQLE